MEKFPSLPVKLSLEEMALRRSVVNYWTEDDIFALFKEFPFSRYSEIKKIWQESVEDKVKDKISKLVIPELIKRQMNYLVTPIGSQIARWGIYFSYIPPDFKINWDFNVLNQLCWTSAAGLDYGKTAEKLVSLQGIDIRKRFKIARDFFLTDYISLLWKELPENFKKFYMAIYYIPVSRNLSEHQNYLLNLYWAYFIKGEENKIVESNADFYLYALKLSAKRGKKAATVYFLNKLTIEERHVFFASEFRNIFRTDFITRKTVQFSKEIDTDVICYLFCQMSPEQQIEILKDCPGRIYQIFLHWPWQDLFLEITDRIWKFLPAGRMYDVLLHDIEAKFDLADYYFPWLFQEFFLRSPSSFKEHIVNTQCRQFVPVPLFKKLLEKKDTNIVKAILRNMSVKDKFDFVSCYGIFRCLESLLVHDSDFVELFIQDACPSVKDRKRLKKLYLKFLLNDGFCLTTSFAVRRWKQLFESLDTNEANILKRSFVLLSLQ